MEKNVNQIPFDNLSLSLSLSLSHTHTHTHTHTHIHTNRDPCTLYTLRIQCYLRRIKERKKGALPLSIQFRNDTLGKGK